RDNWTVGYTPELVVGVWAGNADNRPTRELAGAMGAAPIWHEFMVEALQGKAPTTFREPPGIVRRDVCASTGLLPSPLCPATLREVFIAGTEPTRTDTVYVAARICPRSGLPASADCPANEAVERVYEDWSGDLRDWARARGLLPPVVADSDAPPPRSAAGQASPLSGHTAAGPPAASRGADPVFGRQHSVRVTSPVDGALFEIDPTLPADVQRLELTASVADGARRVAFYVDGRRLGTLTAPPYRALWPIAPGEHRIWAIAEAPDGQREEGPSVEITVTGGRS
ncbi:MAG TPA: Ig-like domain-containing protein, partial [Chloroflexota bacterium]|nr:Ig-like domain-containing protein [Chloroflexota bacterium]